VISPVDREAFSRLQLRVESWHLVTIQSVIRRSRPAIVDPSE